MINKRYKGGEREYKEANDTNIITVSDVFVTFIKHFRYLEFFVSYNLHDDYDVDRRLVSDSSSMRSLNHF